MNTEEIKKLFENKCTIDCSMFEKLIGFDEKFCRDISGRDDWSELYIGLVDGRFFYYEHTNSSVFNWMWGFLDEMK